ncbi:hypothetical protein CGRA01v4_06358 [Colletotrichum graminicola]|nr:hypothetical protein CGRA01v4_06358 [Colletotrichum graminicola]
MPLSTTDRTGQDQARPGRSGTPHALYMAGGGICGICLAPPPSY